MKKHCAALFCLSALFTPAVFADTDEMCLCEECSSCSSYMGKRCVECECYTPACYDLDCDWGLYLTVDFLYWYAHETGIPYALEVKGLALQTITTPALGSVPESLKNIGSSWSPGVRAGLGWNTENDGWDAYLYWTWYQTTKTNHSSVPNYGITSPYFPTAFFPGNGQLALLSPYQNPSITIFGVATVDSVASKWMFDVNAFDLELGRKFWLSRAFTMRPFAALRGAWTDTKFEVNTSRSNAVTDFKGKDHFNNQYWGIGLAGGFQPDWYFCHNFILYANLGGALIWGEAKATKTENYVSAFEALNALDKFHNSTSKMVPIIDLALGLRWEEKWCCNSLSTALEVGWEHHEWFGLNERFIANGPLAAVNGGGAIAVAPSGFTISAPNVGFGGLVIRGRIDF